MRHIEPPFYAQGQEDKICLRLLRRIGERSRCAVEFGAHDGLYKSNTAYFRTELGWRVVLFDSEPRAPFVIAAMITAENINDIFRAHSIPDDVDIVSIDIDGNDLWVWKALTFEPTLVVIEYNPRWRPARRRTVPYNAGFQWDKSDYYGASAGALVALGHEKGYVLAASTEYNLIFAREGLIEEKPLMEVKRRAHSKIRDPLHRAWASYP